LKDNNSNEENQELKHQTLTLIAIKNTYKVIKCGYGQKGEELD